MKRSAQKTNKYCARVWRGFDVLAEMNKEAEVAHTDLTSAKSETADLILSAKDIAEHLSSHSAKVVGLSNLLDNNKIKEILAEAFSKM